MKIIENRKKFYALSLLVILIGLAFMVINSAQGKGAFSKDIEFTGGSLVQINMEQPFSNELREELMTITKDVTGHANVNITSAGTTDVIITMPRTEAAIRNELFTTIKDKYDLKDEVAAADEDVSASISKDIKVGALKAVAVGVILILIYISLRFSDYKFGMSAIAALVHDVCVMLAVYAIFRIPLNNSFIAAMLTIVGYSINDTIIVFDRIRENKVKKGVKEHQAVNPEIVNGSIQQTVSRSICTSITTVVMVLLLFVLGTDSVKEFAFPLIIGILAGTYSSIFIASPLWYDLTHLKNKNGSNKKSPKKDKKKEALS